MEDWLNPLDAEKLGLSPEETDFIQDDKIGKGLFRFYNSRHKDVFFRLALRAIKVFELDCSRIHHDTTTVMMWPRVITKHPTATGYTGFAARKRLSKMWKPGHDGSTEHSRSSHA